MARTLVNSGETQLDSQYPELLRELTLLARAVGAGDDAEDVAQDTLLHARDKFGQLRDQDLLRPWLRRSAVRRAIATRRRIARWVSRESPSWAPDDVTLGLDVRTAIRRLPRGEQLALTLVYGLGYSQAEAAEALGVSRGTVATSLFRARRKLAHSLVDYWDRGGR